MSQEYSRFTQVSQPELRVAAGAFSSLVELLSEQGFFRPVLVTGGRSVRGRDQWGEVTEELLRRGIEFLEFTVRGEPGPETVNPAVGEIIRELPGADVVVAVGGGSVIDAAKAIAMGVASGGSSFDITRFLEGVGDTAPTGVTLPVIAFPTTAGTGSEATMNAVLSQIGPEGFKKSLRHPRFVPRIAVIDVDLHAKCPRSVTTAAGLDAITQLIEAYLSVAANPITDALAIAGLMRGAPAFARLVAGEERPELRTDMAIAAYLSGVCLASAGLGVVHGFASPLGAVQPVPHGAVCGMLLAPSIEASLDEAREARRPEVHERYLAVAHAMGYSDTPALLAELRRWAAPLGRLRDYGFTEEELKTQAEVSGIKNHPVVLDATVRREILMHAL